MRNLTEKQRRFVNAWVSNGQNGTAAARSAGYKGTEQSIRVTASKLLTLGNVQAAIQEMSGKAIAKAERGAIATLQECLEFETRVLRSRLGDFIGTDGEPAVDKIREAPEGLVKKLRIKSTTDEKGQVYAQHEIELESAQDAAKTLIRHHEDQEGGVRAAGALAQVLQSLPAEVVGAIARGMLSGNGNGHGSVPITVKATVIR